MNKSEAKEKLTQAKTAEELFQKELLPSLKKGSLRLPFLAIRSLLATPKALTSFLVGRRRSVKTIEYVLQKQEHPWVLLFTQKDRKVEEPQTRDVCSFGTLAYIVDKKDLPNKTAHILVVGVARVALEEFRNDDEIGSVGVVKYAPWDLGSEKFLERKVPEILKNAQQQFVMDQVNAQQVNGRTKNKLMGVPPLYDESYRAKLAQMLRLSKLPLDRKLAIFSMPTLRDAFEDFVHSEQIKKEHDEMLRRVMLRTRQQLDATQRDYLINQQIDALKRELSNGGGEEDDGDKILQRLETEGRNFPEAVKERVRQEVRKLNSMPPVSSEASVIRGYIDTLFDVPWDRRTEVSTDLEKAKEQLDSDHWGLEKVKERILEYLAVHRRVPDSKAPILCFVGAPGVGKTSLGRSIALATNREYVRMALGGLHDEAEIRGHRRTYVGAMPGRIVKNLMKCKTLNPLFLFDEIDKIAADHRGDPAAALLEVLDPEQNKAFEDNYLELPLDLSKVLFMATSNSYDIPPALLDRMEVISLSGYTEDEKVHIAERHLIPKQMKETGLTRKDVAIDEEVIRDVIRYWTSEAGVRKLRQQINKLLRKVVLQIERKKATCEKENRRYRRTIKRIKANELPDFLGPKQNLITMHALEPRVGVVNGLAWTSAGGDLLRIETVAYSGKGNILRTGSLGDVMKESIDAARSVVRARARMLGLTEDDFTKKDIHLHAPDGATPKDGPSAGAAITTALVSVLTNIPIRSDVAMTGEINLRGKVTEIGGLKEKILAAQRAGIKKVLIPHDNIKDLVEVPKGAREALDIVSVSTIEEVLAHALVEMPKPKAKVEEKAA